MVPIAGKPCIEHIIELLRQHGIEDIVVTMAYLPQAIRSYLGDGSELGVRLEYSVEDTPLGTAGSVKKAEDFLDETFLVISGDALTDIDLGALIAFHREREAVATLAVKSVENPLEFGVVIADEEGRVERFLEKPGWGQVFSDTINTGIYVLEPDCLRQVPDSEPYDFSKQLFPRLLKAGRRIFAYRVPDDEYWQDIGNLDQFREANRDALDGRVRLNIPGVRLKENIWLGEGVAIGDIDQIVGPAAIGRFCTIEPGARIGPYSSLGPNVVVKDGAEINRSVIEQGSYVGGGARITGSIVGRLCDVHANAVLGEGVAIGDESSIGADVVITPGVRIYPYKTVEPGATIRQNLIWESRGVSRLVGEQGAIGVVNVDITPEVAMRLAMAYGTVLRRGDRIVASRDAHPASRMLCRAMMSGVQAAGVTVEDLRNATTALTRHEIRSSRLAGGFHVRMADYDPEMVEIVFFDPPGVLASQATRSGVERLYGRQEFRRVTHEGVGTIVEVPRAVETYVHDLVSLVDTDSIVTRGFRLVVDYANSPAATLANAVFSTLGVEVIGVNAGGDRPLRRRLEDSAESIGRLVSAAGADAGVLLDAAAEGVHLVDDRARIVSEDRFLLLLLRLLLHDGRSGVAALPVTVSQAAERLVEGSGIAIRRTPAAPAAVMAAATADDVIIAGLPAGSVAFPSFLPAPDALATTVFLLQLLARVARPLSALVDDLPETTLVTADVPCPWRVKGTVMRLLIEQVKDLETSSLDGLRIQHPEGWVQVLPDADLPVVHLLAEGADREASEALLDRYREQVETIVREHAELEEPVGVKPSSSD
jgi:mannose-1-phosphate guanylyltransferase/phosphomannomutase